jgi:hypothetical protein
MLYHENLAITGFKLTILAVIGTGCKGSCKFNYHAIMTAQTAG